uniref:Uncharacterized protein n=1 Tax=Pararge aegeria TaxID=116150 RepID=S4NS15_9NEOP
MHATSRKICVTGRDIYLVVHMLALQVSSLVGGTDLESRISTVLTLLKPSNLDTAPAYFLNLKPSVIIRSLK